MACTSPNTPETILLVVALTVKVAAKEDTEGTGVQLSPLMLFLR